MFKSNVQEWCLTKRLRLIKKVREHYTRIDVPCGFPCCSPSVRSADSYVIPTSDILSNHKALLKSSHINPIICQSVLRKVDDQGYYADLINERNYVKFDDEFCELTYNKGLESVLEFYRSHVCNKSFSILSAENVESYSNDPLIKDLTSTISVGEDTVFTDYKDNLEILSKDDGVVRGTLLISLYNHNEGSIVDRERRIKVIGANNMNRALHRDEVYVEIISVVCANKSITPEDVSRTQNAMNEHKTRKISSNDAIEPRNGLGNCKLQAYVYYGKVIGISKRRPRSVIGTVIPESYKEGLVLVQPIDRFLPPIRVKTCQFEKLINKRLKLEINDWNVNSLYPNGHYYEIMSGIGEKEHEIEAILYNNAISYFKDSWDDILVLAYKEKMGSTVDLHSTKKLENYREEPCWSTEAKLFMDSFSITSAYQETFRLDIRDYDVMSIDPPGCTDIDDALHCRRLLNGNWEYGVHIADVTHYVKPGTVLDMIACDRGTTVYLYDRRIDMLPAFLSTNLCSLREGVDRASFSIFWEVDHNFNILDIKFAKSLIKSKKAFTYEEAFNHMHDRGSKYYNALNKLNEFSLHLRKCRFDRGALDLSSNELKVEKDKICQKQTFSTNFLVEEYMLLANVSVAEHIYKYCSDTSLLRRHPPPSEFDLPDEIDTSNNLTINKSLEKSKNRDIIKRMVVKCMNQAYYFVSGTTTDFSHYGLAASIYTHFTSPIRRYADIVVHRILNSILEKEALLKDKEGKLLNNLDHFMDEVFVDKNVCKNLNLRHRNAQKASWDCTRLAIYYILREKVPVTEGYVIIKYTKGVVVYIPEYNLEEPVETEETFELFARISVKIKRNDELFFIRQSFDITIMP